MHDFLERAAFLRRTGSEGIGEEFEQVLNLLAELQVVHQKSFLDLDNVETLFGAVEMGRLLGGLPGRRIEEVEELHTNLITVIVKTLEKSIPFPVYEGKQIRPPVPYSSFAEMLRALRDQRGVSASADVLTFNYDLCLDYALHYHGLRYNYGLQGDVGDTLRLLKLHGSINWGVCSECGEVAPFTVDKVRFNLVFEPEKVFYDLGSRITTISHCEQAVRAAPLLVPPSWDKTTYHKDIANVWSHAANALGAAENIFVLGYSLPESDAFFRYLFALGTATPTKLRRLWVFNPDPGGDVADRFQALIGGGVARQFRFFKGEDGFFHNAIPVIRKALEGDVGN